jgi:hypothetical protein
LIRDSKSRTLVALVALSSVLMAVAYPLASGASISTTITTTQAPSSLLTTSLSVGFPGQTSLGGYQAVTLAFTNNLNVTISSVVYGSIINSSNQTVSITTATMTLSPKETQTAYLFILAPGSGTYSFHAFAVSSSSVPISPESSFNINI